MKPTVFYRILLVSVLLTISYAASAQMYVGGSVGGSYAHSKTTNAKEWSLNVSPEVGYIFNDRWAVGGIVSYGKAKSRIDSPYLDSTKESVTLFSINPYVIYAPLKYRNFAVCAEMGALFVPKQSGVNFATYGAYVSPLLTYSINDHIILKTGLDFAKLSVSGTTNGSLRFGASVGGDNAINLSEDLSIGFIYRF